MQWSRLRSAIEGRFAPALKGRVSLHQARYRHANEEVGRVWIAADGRELASFATGARWRQVRAAAEQLMAERGGRGRPAAYEQAVSDAAAALRHAGGEGEADALTELESYLSLSIDAALASASALQQALAVLDARVGKRRLAALLAAPPGHPPLRALLELRCAAEGVGPRPPTD